MRRARILQTIFQLGFQVCEHTSLAELTSAWGDLVVFVKGSAQLLVS